MTLDMLYSTFEDGIYSLIKNLPPKKENVYIIIIHQISPYFNDDNIKIFLNNRGDIKYYKSSTKGVAKSRNIAINKSSSDIILFCDDDVIYSANFQDIILNKYATYTELGFITFAYSNHTSMSDFASKFSKKEFMHTLKSILRVGTIEVTARRSIILNNNIKFPEDMGAGTKYFLCDEPVFLSTFLKKKIKGMYAPEIICFHPEESSGKNFNNIDAFASRYLCFTRIFGRLLGFSLYMIYLVKNFNKFDGLISLKNALFIKFKINHDHELDKN